MESYFSCLDNIKNNIDFSNVIRKRIFFVDLGQIFDSNDLKMVKKICAKITGLVIEYLPVNNDIIKDFQLIDIRNRRLKNSVVLFIENFLNAFDKHEYQIILSLF